MALPKVTSSPDRWLSLPPRPGDPDRLGAPCEAQPGSAKRHRRADLVVPLGESGIVGPERRLLLEADAARLSILPRASTLKPTPILVTLGKPRVIVTSYY
jgi:hypothetical protein